MLKFVKENCTETNDFTKTNNDITPFLNPFIFDTLDFNSSGYHFSFSPINTFSLFLK